MLGEAARTFADGRRYFDAYVGAIDAVGRDPAAGHSISVKLSALHPRYEVAKWDECVPALTDMLVALAEQAAAKGIALTVDAEESERLDMSLEIIGNVAALPSLKGWEGFGMAVQAYGKRARPVVHWADGLDRDHERAARQGRLLGQRDQAYAGRGPVRTTRCSRARRPPMSATSRSPRTCSPPPISAPHLRAITRLPSQRSWNGRATVATSNSSGCTGWATVSTSGWCANRAITVGSMRRSAGTAICSPIWCGGLLENGANSSFVHQLADERLSENEILADPVAKIAAVGGSRHPSDSALPVDLFSHGAIATAQGIDLNERDCTGEDDVRR